MTKYGLNLKTVAFLALLVPMSMPPFVGAIGLRQLLARCACLSS
jgi:hypothetical protein